MEKALIHMYCGDGKGKTTAAVGAAVRCAGAGGKVLFMQFMKNGCSGERIILSEIKNITLMPCYDEMKFVWNMTDNEKAAAGEYYGRAFKEICMIADDYDMIVLDEITSVVKYGFVEQDKLCEFLMSKHGNAEIIMTGREPSAELIDISDYVSEIKKRKHPYDKGISARKFIEF